jgi:hypothetical protein
MSNFQFDQGAIDKFAKDAVKGEANRIQKLMDDLLRSYTGRPVSEVKVALAREWSKGGGNISDPELTEYATHISEGRHIEIRT